MSYVDRMTEIYREVIGVVHQLVPGTSTETWDRIFAEAASNAPPELDMKEAIERATDALIDAVDPHHSFERSYWRPQAANILANAFMAERRA